MHTKEELNNMAANNIRLRNLGSFLKNTPSSDTLLQVDNFFRDIALTAPGGLVPFIQTLENAPKIEVTQIRKFGGESFEKVKPLDALKTVKKLTEAIKRIYYLNFERSAADVAPQPENIKGQHLVIRALEEQVNTQLQQATTHYVKAFETSSLLRELLNSVKEQLEIIDEFLTSVSDAEERQRVEECKKALLQIKNWSLAQILLLDALHTEVGDLGRLEQPVNKTINPLKPQIEELSSQQLLSVAKLSNPNATLDPVSPRSLSPRGIVEHTNYEAELAALIERYNPIDKEEVQKGVAARRSRAESLVAELGTLGIFGGHRTQTRTETTVTVTPTSITVTNT